VRKKKKKKKQRQGGETLSLSYKYIDSIIEEVEEPVRESIEAPLKPKVPILNLGEAS